MAVILKWLISYCGAGDAAAADNNLKNELFKRKLQNKTQIQISVAGSFFAEMGYGEIEEMIRICVLKYLF